MNTAIVGYTGFVGSNICLSYQFDARYNSKNVREAYGTCPDLLVYTGVPAEMFTANTNPEKDLDTIKQAFENMQKITPHRLVLISTISVYPNFNEGDETTEILSTSLKAYGANRLYLEKKVRETFQEALIIRLPALFGEGIKKNFIYDLIHFIPALLKTEKYKNLFSDSPLAKLYENRGDGFYKCIAKKSEERKHLKQFFTEKGFSALNFTDSRSSFQFFNLAHLWNIIDKALKENLRLLTITSEPISVAELYANVYHETFINEISDTYPNQNLKSIHANSFGGKNGYIYDKGQMMGEIMDFVNQQKKILDL